MARYSIGIYDCAAQYGSSVWTDHLDMARVVRDALAARYPGKMVLVSDNERDGRVLADDELDEGTAGLGG